MVDSRTTEAIALMDSKSPCEAAAKPASMTSTRRRSSCLAMRTFSSLVIDAPGDCSPSRSVVSKMSRRLDELFIVAPLLWLRCLKMLRAYRPCIEDPG